MSIHTHSTNTNVVKVIAGVLFVVLLCSVVWLVQENKINKLQTKNTHLQQEITELKENPLNQALSTVLEETTTKARNTERETDIKALQGQIEAYYAINGKYPTIEDLNNPSFRSANMQGLDAESLRDPQGSEPKLVSQSVENSYLYAPTPADCDNFSRDCTSYTLSAAYEGTVNGQTVFRKTALN